MFLEVREHPAIQELLQLWRKGESPCIKDLWDGPKSLLSALLQQETGEHLFIVTGSHQDELRLFHNFALFSEREVVDFPAWDTLPGEDLTPTSDIVGERYSVLRRLLQKDKPLIVLASAAASAQPVIPPERLSKTFLSLSKERFPDFSTLLYTIEEMGYQYKSVAADKGEFAARRGLVDIFPVNLPAPIRIEYRGDSLDSLRIYDPEKQVSTREVPEVSIEPALEKEWIESSESTIADYLDHATLILDDVAEHPLAMRQHLYFSNEHPCSEYCTHWRSPFQRVGEFLLKEEGKTLSPEEVLGFLGPATKKSTKVYLPCDNETQEKTLRQKVQELASYLPPQAEFVHGYLSSGFAIDDLLCFPFAELSGQLHVRRPTMRTAFHSPQTQTFDLEEGDLAVHTQHGVGRFLGIKVAPDIFGVEREHFFLEYSDRARLFVPLHQAHLLTKYVGVGKGVIHLDTLGAKRWGKTKEKAERAVLAYAADLLHLYAKREAKRGLEQPGNGPQTINFDESFPYNETDDQKQAIEDVRNDMMQPKAMDRLVCGDVGYGKTEVAMRATAKAVLDGCKQVAMLVPTTVLALQHYETFSARMQPFGIRVALLSRHLSASKAAKITQQAAEGEIDVLIGTHRILNKNLSFHDLGLLIIDEEHRFGVQAKEHLKKIKQDLDCLTLSATPIPRTLHMSLTGLRDLSVIHTPPEDRLPIRSFIVEKKDKILRQALERELVRGGQVYVIHNRVQSINSVAAYIQKLAPKARVAIGHGQMSSVELDDVFHQFRNGEADILVATTIVQNGIDVPNANTIIIFSADHFGLADLYQLRGRVGRWNRPAYCYFVAKEANERLDTLLETSGRGGGYKIAVKDLQIRGAGNLLGEAQSGQASAVGFELYCQLLNRAVHALKSNTPLTFVESKVEIPVDMGLSADYVNEQALRIEFYHRLGIATELQEVDAIWEELQDRFGPPPEPVHWLYHLSRIKVVAGQKNIRHIKATKVSVTISFNDKRNVRKIWRLPKTPKETEAKLLEMIME